MTDKDIREDFGGPDEVPPSERPRSEGGPATREPEPRPDGAPPGASSASTEEVEAGIAPPDLPPSTPVEADDRVIADVPNADLNPAPSLAGEFVDRGPRAFVLDEVQHPFPQEDAPLPSPPLSEPETNAAVSRAIESEPDPTFVAETPPDPESATSPLAEVQGAETAEVAAREADAADREPWRGAIAEALAEPPGASFSEVLGSSEAEQNSREPSSEPALAAGGASSVGASEASFTSAAEGLFRPPAIDEEPHLITIGRRLNPSLSVARPVVPDITPRPDPAVAREPWWRTVPWADHLRTGARYAAYAVGGYLALVLVLILLFRFVNPPGSMLMLTQFLTGTSIDRRWAPLDSISRNLVRAVIVSEDGRFCEHSGIDTAAIKEAIERASRGTPRGASTISMQVTKNLFLWNAKSYVRKVIEIPLTLFMELIWPKSRILEVYLNIAEWGPGVFGAEAAAQRYFGKPASRLSEREAALLAAALPNPAVRNPAAPNRQTSAKARVVQSRVRAYGAVATCVTSAAAPPSAEPAVVRPRTIRKTPPKPAARKKPPADDWAPTLNFGSP